MSNKNTKIPEQTKTVSGTLKDQATDKTSNRQGKLRPQPTKQSSSESYHLLRLMPDQLACNVREKQSYLPLSGLNINMQPAELH